MGGCDGFRQAMQAACAGRLPKGLRVSGLGGLEQLLNHLWGWRQQDPVPEGGRRDQWR